MREIEVRVVSLEEADHDTAECWLDAGCSASPGLRTVSWS
jgi:hypothetical protein